MNELQIHQTKEVQEYELMKKQAAAFYQSGMFPDIKSHAQALVKVMTGKELGLAPFASITGIHIVSGKPVLGANLIATMIANHERYAYKVIKATNQVCEIDFYENKQLVGRSSFTIEEAQVAGLVKKDNWTKYPSDMLFARAISRGSKRFTPGIFGGTSVYTPDELGVDTDEDGVVISPKETKEKMFETAERMEEIVEEIKKARIEKRMARMDEAEKRIAALNNDAVPEPYSDEAIIEDIKKTTVISEEFR